MGGCRKRTDDLRDQGDQVSKNWIARLASLSGILAQIGYKRRPGRYGGTPARVKSNTLDRQTQVDAADKVRVTAIIYIKTRARWERRVEGRPFGLRSARTGCSSIKSPGRP